MNVSDVILHQLMFPTKDYASHGDIIYKKTCVISFQSRNIYMYVCTYIYCVIKMM